MKVVSGAVRNFKGKVRQARRYARVVLEFAQTIQRRGLVVATSMARTSKVGQRINSILEGRMGLTHSMRHFCWAIMLSVAVPAVYSASAFQLTPVLKTLPSPYASMSYIDGYRAILADGWTLTSDGSAKFESDIERDSENLAVRICFFSYYT